jgi:hypothetical protein
MTIPWHHLIRELAATNVTFFKNGGTKTLEPESSDEEKRIVSPTSAQGPL